MPWSSVWTVSEHLLALAQTHNKLVYVCAWALVVVYFLIIARWPDPRDPDEDLIY